MANKTPTPIVLRLDRSKKFSTVHGDRSLDDPHSSVQFFQDGLPYDAEGILVPDNGQTTPIDSVIDGQRVRFQPLYNDAMREKVKRKQERIAKGLAKDDVNEHDDESVQEDASEDVNLESWLRGEIKYPPFKIFAACKRRFSKSYSKLRDVVDDLVLDEKLIPEREVDPSLLKLISTTAS